MIRPATTADAQAIFDLIRELAIYEKAEDQHWLEPQDYARDLEAGLFKCDLAIVEGQVVGMILYYPRFSTWKGKMYHLEDFIVKERFRGQGIGKRLFDHFLDEAENANCSMVIWQVLDWNEPAINFYKKYNTVFDPEWWDGKIYFNVNNGEVTGGNSLTS